MPLISSIAVFVIAVMHLGFMWLEIVLWDKPQGRRIFNTSEAFATQSKALAANQGLYNGFLATGLLWSLLPVGAVESAKAIALFFLGCVTIAGLFGAFTVSRRILFIQAAPAALALILVARNV